MKLRPLTQEELRQELYWCVLDLCGDVLLLDCLLSAQEDKREENAKNPSLWESQAVRAELKKRLGGYIEQHARDAVIVAEALLAPKTC